MKRARLQTRATSNPPTLLRHKPHGPADRVPLPRPCPRPGWYRAFAPSLTRNHKAAAAAASCKRRWATSAAQCVAQWHVVERGRAAVVARATSGCRRRGAAMCVGRTPHAPPLSGYLWVTSRYRPLHTLQLYWYSYKHGHGVIRNVLLRVERGRRCGPRKNTVSEKADSAKTQILRLRCDLKTVDARHMARPPAERNQHTNSYTYSCNRSA